MLTDAAMALPQWRRRLLVTLSLAATATYPISAAAPERTLSDAFVPAFSASLDDGVDMELPIRYVQLYGTSGDDDLSPEAYDVLQGAVNEYLQDWWTTGDSSSSSSHLSTLSNVRSEIVKDDALIDFDNNYELAGNTLEMLITLTFREGGGNPTIEEGASGGPFQVGDSDAVEKNSESSSSTAASFMPPKEDVNAAVTRALESDFSSPAFLQNYFWSILDQVPQAARTQLAGVSMVVFHEKEQEEAGQSDTIGVDAAGDTTPLPDFNSPVITMAGDGENAANERAFSKSKPLNVVLLVLLILLLIGTTIMCYCCARRRGYCAKRCGNKDDDDVTLGPEIEIDSESAQYDNEREHEANNNDDSDNGNTDELADATPAERAAHSELDGYVMASRSNSFRDPNDAITEPDEAGMAPEVLKVCFPLPEERRSWLSKNRIKHKVVISE